MGNERHFKQERIIALNSSERFSLYASFKSNLLTEILFDFVYIKCPRDALIKLRIGVLPLNANCFRYAREVVKMKLRMKFTSFASVRYTKNFG